MVFFRRNQVEERKRLIWEAELERREAIIRKNRDREARIEAKRKNERSHIVFAFGSSTPRMLEPADTGGATFWGTRRATSTTNVMMFSAAQPLTRRSSERELDGSKKRATSAGGLDRKPGEGRSLLYYLFFFSLPFFLSLLRQSPPSTLNWDGRSELILTRTAVSIVRRPRPVDPVECLSLRMWLGEIASSLSPNLYFNSVCRISPRSMITSR